MTQLQAFLFALDNTGTWMTLSFTELEPLISATKVAMRGDEAVALIHVGFWQPTTQEVAAIAAERRGSLIVSDSAAGALSGHLAVGGEAIGCIQGVVFRLALDGWTTRKSIAENIQVGTEAPIAMASSPVVEANPKFPALSDGDWLSALASSDAGLFAQAKDAGVVDEESYLRLEATLPRPLRRLLGMTRWSLVAGGQPDIETILESLWASPPWFADIALASLGLTVRQSNVFRAHNLQKVADISAIGPEGLMKLPNLGHGSVYGLRKLILDAVAWPESAAMLSEDDDSAPDMGGEGVPPQGLGGLRSGFEAAAALLNDLERHVWTGRLGFEFPQMTLQELADSMGVSRERVRQLETQVYRKVEHHPFWPELARRLDGALQARDDALLLSTLPMVDPWFVEAPSLAAPLANSLRHLLSERFGAFQIAGEWVVSHLRPQAWNEICRSARTLLESCARDRMEVGVVRWQLDQLLNGRGAELRPALWSEATAKAQWSTRQGQPRRLVSLDDDAQSVVLAVLESSDEPLHYNEIHRRAVVQCASAHDMRYLQNAAHAVSILFGRGTYGLHFHCPLSSEELTLVRAEVEDVIAGGDPARQWHASELCDALLERGLGFDGRLTKYVLNHALKDCSALVDLRRMVWGLGAAWQAGASSRLDVRQAVIALLEAQGRPMSTAEVRERLAAIRGINQTFQIFPSDPLVRIGPGMWGLLHRDVDLLRAQPLLALLREVLQARQAGLHLSELQEVLNLNAGEGAAGDRSWLAAAESAGVRIDKGQYAYLSDWGESRRIAVLEAVKRAVAEVEAAGVVFEDICGRVNALTKLDVPTSQVSQALRCMDLSYDPLSRLWVSEAMLPTGN